MAVTRATSPLIRLGVSSRGNHGTFSCVSTRKGAMGGLCARILAAHPVALAMFCAGVDPPALFWNVQAA